MKLKTEPMQEKPSKPAALNLPESANRGKRRILFEYQAEPGSDVFVAGDFNGWDKSKHRLTDKGHPGHFRRHVFLEPGQLEYKFVIDGVWQIDPQCTRWSPNRFGTLNSVLEIE